MTDKIAFSSVMPRKAWDKWQKMKNKKCFLFFQFLKVLNKLNRDQVWSKIQKVSNIFAISFFQIFFPFIQKSARVTDDWQNSLFFGNAAKGLRLMTKRATNDWQNSLFFGNAAKGLRQMTKNKKWKLFPVFLISKISTQTKQRSSLR